MDGDTIGIVSTRGPDDEPVCEITWGPLQWYAPVEAVRQTAEDLFTCAAYADMLIELSGVTSVPPEVLSEFGSALLGRAVRDRPGRTRLGNPDTIGVLPAGSTRRREPLVVLSRGCVDGTVSRTTAPAKGRRW